MTLADLIHAGLLIPPIDLEKTYKGQRLKARVEKDGKVKFDGKVYDSPSMAAGMARASVIGLGTDGRPPATNGWIFWQFKGTDGKPVFLDVARQKLGAAGAQAAG